MMHIKYGLNKAHKIPKLFDELYVEYYFVTQLTKQRKTAKNIGLGLYALDQYFRVDKINPIWDSASSNKYYLLDYYVSNG